MKFVMCKKFLLYPMLIMFILLNVGCAKTENNIQNEDQVLSGEQTLVYCTWEDEKDYTEKLVQAFMSAYPNYTIETEYIPSSLSEIEIMDVLETEHPDIIGLKNINQVLYLANERQVVNITDEIESSNIDVAYYGNMYNNLSIDGAYYCLPTRKTCWVLAYNKKIFDDAGMEYPGEMTWDEYAQLALNLTHETENGKQWGGCFVNWIYNFMGIQEQNYLFDDDITYLQESLEFMNRIYNIDKSHMSIDDMEQTSWLDAFEDGHIAMMPQGEWFVGMILEDEKSSKTDVDWDLAPMPCVSGQRTGTTWGVYQVAAITSHCENQAAAFRFLEYLCGEDGAEIYASNGMIPAYINDEIKSIYTRAIGDHNVDAFFDAYQIQEMPIYEGYNQLEDIVEEEALLYLKGEQTIDQTMNKFIKKREDYYFTR